MKMLHRLKIKFLRVRWYFDLLNYARAHGKEVDNYKFLVDIRKSAYDSFLEKQRINPDDPDVKKLDIQIKLIDKILGYVDRR